MSVPLGSSLHHHRRGDLFDRPASRASRPTTVEPQQPRKRSLSLGGFLSRSSHKDDNSNYPYVEKESRSHRRSSQHSGTFQLFGEMPAGWGTYQLAMCF